MTPAQIAATIAIGVGASVLMDAWNLFLKRAFGIASLNYGLLGRWILHMPSGRFTHDHIAKADPKAHEDLVGWTAHYSIGVAFAFVLVLLASAEWLVRPTFAPALLVGIVTVVFPLFLMQPCLGFGVAAARTPNPAQARLKSFATHTVFGAGLYLSALVLGKLLPV